MPGWKYIFWAHGGEGMTPTEELFDLGNDPHEMRNAAAEPRHAAILAEMRRRYDAEVASIASSRIAGHGYEHYPVLFSRTIPWPLKPAPAAPPAAKGQRKAGKRTDGG